MIIVIKKGENTVFSPFLIIVVFPVLGTFSEDL
jgi:hypothetical protein